MGETETTGTPGATQDGADAASAASGTPAASTDGGDARTNADDERIRKLEEIREKYLANLETVERANEILREQASRASTPPTGYDPAAQRVTRASQLLQNIAERDPEMAQAMTELVGLSHEENQTAIQRQQAEQRFYRELGAIPAEDQSEVERAARAERLWPSIAYHGVKARRYDKEKSELAEQRRKMQEQEDRQRRGVVSTTASPAPPAPRNGEMTMNEYDQLIADARKGNADARKRLDDVEYGRVRVKPG